MTKHYDNILSFCFEHPWAITRPMLTIVAGILARRLVGEEPDPAEIAAALVSRKNAAPVAQGRGVAVIPIYGVIAPRMNMLSDMSGGTTFEALSAQLQAAVKHPDVGTIVFDVDSPGGNVAGAAEFAADVLKARTQKPIIAQVHYLMASAAYWPMAGATQIVASPSAMVGSIGVYHIHDDISEALAKHGVKRTVISAGKFKAEGADGGPLTDEAREHVKHLVGGAYDRFVKDVAAGRGVAVGAVRNGYGEGRVVTADDALALGMIDRIGTLDDTLARAMSTSATPQESHRATTGQELPSDAIWQNSVAAALLELDI
jgi:signal peptide peptidase SppA